MTEHIKNPLSGKLRGVTYEDGKIIDVHIRDTDDVVKVFVPVRHGRWIKVGYAFGEGEYRCSECKETEWRTSASRLKYCPFCGAMMDGGAD